MKTWKRTLINNHCEQELLIQPTPQFDGIELSFNNIEEPSKDSGIFYINKDELKVIIEELQSMMNYVNLK